MNSDESVPVAVVTLKPRHALPFFKHHPWVFAGAIRSVQGDPQPGDEVVLKSHEGEFIARGLFNPHSQIRVRLYSWDEAASLNRTFWKARLQSAFQLRELVFATNQLSGMALAAGIALSGKALAAGHSPVNVDPELPAASAVPLSATSPAVTAYRLVNSEADGLSGLTVDRYDRWLSVQFTSLAIARRQNELIELLCELAQPAGIVLRTEKGLRDAEGLEIADGLLWGEPPPRPLIVIEHGLKWEVDLTEGQKTGSYLDQRDNRRALARYVHGHRVLDVFCYAGGFGLGALVWGGASEVLAVDSSEPALQLAQRNAELNGVADRWRSLRADGFKALEQLRDANEQFDTVVLDPPKLTRTRAALPQAMRAYHSLNRLAVSVLKPGGLLVTCSCSGLVTRDGFEQMLADVAIQSGRDLRIIEIRGAAPDHPVSPFCPENEYLKCYFCQVT
ncbi:MAG: class I SAM-dependent rRNA methyltransferase [Planctomycetaceae bacterium]